MVAISRGRGCCSPYLKVFLQGLVTSTSAPINSFLLGTTTGRICVDIDFVDLYLQTKTIHIHAIHGYPHARVLYSQALGNQSI